MYNVVANILQHVIPSQNYTISISKYHVINTSSQNLFGHMAPANGMSILSLAFSILFPLLVVLILLFLLIGYVTGSKSVKETASAHMKDLAIIIILAGIVNAYGFTLFYNILHIGYFFNHDFKMYNSLSSNFFSIWSGSVFLKAVVKGLESQIVTIAKLPVIVEEGGAEVAITATVIGNILAGVLSSIIPFALDGFKITWIMLFLLSFAQVVSITYLLPLGIVFRAFPPTKAVGAGLISLALGLGFVLPIVTYVFTAAAFYIKNNGVFQTVLGPMTMNQISNYPISISSAWYIKMVLFPVHSTELAVLLPLKALLNYTIFLLMMGTVIPTISITVTMITIYIISSYLGGTKLFLPRILV